MTTITRQGVAIELSGTLPETGSAAPLFSLVKTDLEELSLQEMSGTTVILNIFPSIDTPTCARSVRRFNEEATRADNVIVLCISPDLPFAHARFCEVEGIDRVIPLSTFRSPDFGLSYGIMMMTTQRCGLLARALVIVDGAGLVKYTELVPELTQEPDYELALNNI